ncbi:undecaprenyl-diphosphatase [Clostridium thermosuccinogenes]|uniref:Undecaprenyl-diphosphatase n=1 Tax=Clostridium thermosuccinogenes TaxID=84032 RepID=A0A2K2FBZ6_9CLOT|nr:undecaprenyl-diphosphatase [Pseudoclostridium thermosuccinogenes]PNT91661.1 undecaprenyl-diphosphatase [Pseudoclostridium thermosuccinogenes]PNT95282.1 undecaprenyl-diphosphatase [Pseudoclostridium thermosuccinogenes]PNT96312.1 undecaprenyl-diphosphatase [Pseudoclostridium thermosuccinogenes]
MLNSLEAFILGLVQGLTEFLPISSSGHLVIFQRLFGLHDVITFDVAVHFATLVAVCAVLWKDIIEILKRPFSKLPLLIVVGTIPTALIGVLLKDFFDSIFNSAVTLGFEFLITGLVLWYAESVRSRNKGLKEMTYTDATVVGVAQGLAILPAVSRSGLTLAGALSRGLNREFALKFSFLMSIPAILGAAVLDVYDTVKAGSLSVDVLPLVIGMLTAAVSGYLSVRFMLKVFSKTSLKVFSYYVFALGIIIIIEQLVSGKYFGKLF